MPMRRLPALGALRAFEAAARRGSIKAAAEELAVTPGAVSQQIKALEDDLGVALFLRKTRAIYLTTAGQHLQPTLSEAFLQIRQAVDHVRPKPAPRLVISSTNALISKWLLPRLHRFTSKHPALLVHINSEMTQATGVQDSADIDIRYAKSPKPELHCELMHPELMMVVANPSVLDAHAIASPEDLHDAPVIYDIAPVHDGGLTSWELWSKHAGVSRVVNPEKSIRFDRPPGGQIVDAAIAGVGLAICGSLLAYAALSDGRLACPFGPVVPSDHSYFICCPKGRENEPHIRAFFDWALQEAAVLTTLNAMRDASD